MVFLARPVADPSVSTSDGDCRDADASPGLTDTDGLSSLETLSLVGRSRSAVGGVLVAAKAETLTNGITSVGVGEGLTVRDLLGERALSRNVSLIDWS